MVEKVKIGISFLAIISGIVAFNFFDTFPMVLRLTILIASIVVAAFIAWRSEKGQNFLIYSKESISESKKVVWPTKKETFQTTAIVVAFVIVMAIFLWFVDSILGWIVGILLGTKE